MKTFLKTFTISASLGLYAVLCTVAYLKTCENIEKSKKEVAYLTIDGTNYVLSQRQFLELAAVSLDEELILSLECMPGSRCEVLAEAIKLTPKN